jgi:glycosyltransferase involved in cell wall biosynthesis
MSEEGVNVVGHVHEATGRGEIARLLIASLAHAGIPHVVIPVGPRPARNRLRPPAPVYDTNVLCVNPDLLPTLVESMGRRLLRERRTIGFWWWEVDRLPPALAWAAYLVDEIWVGSEYVRTAVAPSVPRPVHVFPVPLVRPRTEVVARSDYGLPDGRFAFVFSFNFASVFERKNPLGLIDAFSHAFAEDEGPILVIKAAGGGRHREELRLLRTASEQRRDVFVLEGMMRADRYHGLVAACDAYASLHRAEGFGLPIAEAMELGKPAVATGYSGNLEFMTEANSYLVASSPVPVPDGIGPYSAGGIWAEPDLKDAAVTLRRVLERRDEVRARAAVALSDFASGRRFDHTTSFVRSRLDEPAVPSRVPTDRVERAAYELMWGPDLDDARPWARRLRSPLRPFLRPYLNHQREVSALILDAIRESSQVTGTPPDRGGKSLRG